MKYVRIIIWLLLIFNAINCKRPAQNADQTPSYHLDYELKSPAEFALGKLTTSNGICFSKDGTNLYTSKPIEKKFRNGKSLMGIFIHTFNNGKWEEPELIDFEIDIDAYHPVLSYDNNILFFNSRSHADSTNFEVPHNIWYAVKTKSGWSTPEMVEGVNSEFYDSYPSPAKNNNLYFNSDRPGGKGGMDIYISKFKNGKYQLPINLEALNSIDAENDLVLDPNENFIIFNRYINATNEIDLYVSFRKNGIWDSPKKLDKINMNNKWELTPTISPDGKYFFYELEGKIMQIDLNEIMDQKNNIQ